MKQNASKEGAMGERSRPSETWNLRGMERRIDARVAEIVANRPEVERGEDWEPRGASHRGGVWGEKLEHAGEG